jgi:hypothetical protein
MDELLEHVSERFREVYVEIAAITDAFCDEHLNDEYKQLCREMAVVACQGDLPVTRGKPRSWAAGIVYSVGWVNFLSDPSQDPHMKTANFAKAIGVSEATIMAKSKVIREDLNLMPLDPSWCLPSRIEDNPLAWMVEVNGLAIDVRTCPREIQEAAYVRGLIPYIPADRGRDGGDMEYDGAKRHPR